MCFRQQKKVQKLLGIFDLKFLAKREGAMQLTTQNDQVEDN